VSDSRWFEIEADLNAAAAHFARAAAIFEARGSEERGLEAYKTEMAFMHAMQSGHTSFEKGLLRILDLLEEDRPSGEQWHADLIRRVAVAMPRRIAFLPAPLLPAAHESRKFRHRATHAYDDFDWARATEAARAATLLSRQLPDLVAAFRAAVDPD